MILLSEPWEDDKRKFGNTVALTGKAGQSLWIWIESIEVAQELNDEFLILSLRRSDQAATMGSSELAAKTSQRELVHSNTQHKTPPHHQHHLGHFGRAKGGEREEERGKRGIINIKGQGKNRFVLTALGRYTSAESRAMIVSVQSHMAGGFFAVK